MEEKQLTAQEQFPHRNQMRYRHVRMDFGFSMWEDPNSMHTTIAYKFAYKFDSIIAHYENITYQTLYQIVGYKNRYIASSTQKKN